MNIEEIKKLDKALVDLIKVDTLARVIGYNDIGEPIELVYNNIEDNYEMHVSGEYIKDVPDSLAQQLFEFKLV